MTRLVKISKFLSYHLRHRPDLLGLELSPGGWVEVNRLLQAAKKHNFSISSLELQQVVEQNDKQRFSFNERGNLIRANQGHSVRVDLQLKPVTPPDVLYHGTYSKAIASIKKQGLKKMSRHHVHLSSDINTAQRVGARRGYPVIFQIDALAMSKAGYIFYCSDNGVWLTEEIPVKYLQVHR
ncbi:putative RNA 2'-phosphotransferase [Hyella patelloides LEGE 07179]|uniref:Probable RNA 2'-phosphotransferase n=1 Tax=Hyella patelloides LEGE 07179 TaxID=945734 RepID=A0A563VSF6_9CYAN|nr:RNA 2'-phosphotransferase [Hyella patelloides]VEP14341.1 putative RNA 2'-phosphotransferase [Hyella patelloides LEGE 07179]